MKSIAAHAPPVSQRGFTLIELMVTLIIAAILLSIAVPSFQNMLARNKLVTVTNDLLTAVRTVRSEAIRLNQSVTLCRVNDSNATACTGAGNWQNWIIHDARGTVIRRGTLGTSGTNPQVTSSLVNGSLAFDSRGTTTFTSAINLNNDEVSVNLFRICTSTLAEDNVRRIKVGVAGNTVTYPRRPDTLTGDCS